MAIVKISDLPLVDQPVEGTDLFVVVQDNVTKKAYASDIQTYVGFEEIQYATAGQTVFNLTTMSYAPGGNNLMVFVDGVNQYEGLSYTETNSTRVTFTQGLHQGAVVKFSTVQTQTSQVANAGAVTFLQAGTGAVARSVQSKERDIVSVKDFGAVGDGVTDDTAAIQAALDTTKTVYFPNGTYVVSSSLTYKSYVYGIQPTNVTINYTGTGFCFQHPTYDAATDLGISGLKIVLSGSGSGGISLGDFSAPINPNYFGRAHFSNLYILGNLSNNSKGMSITQGAAGSYTDIQVQNVDYGFIFDRTTANQMRRLRAQNFNYGFLWTGQSTPLSSGQDSIQFLDILGPGGAKADGYGMKMDAPQNWSSNVYYEVTPGATFKTNLWVTANGYFYKEFASTYSAANNATNPVLIDAGSSEVCFFGTHMLGSSTPKASVGLPSGPAGGFNGTHQLVGCGTQFIDIFSTTNPGYYSASGSGKYNPPNVIGAPKYIYQIADAAIALPQQVYSGGTGSYLSASATPDDSAAGKVSAGSGAGGSPPTPVVASGSNDFRGTITFGTGSAPSGNSVVRVNFSTPMGTTPHVALSINGGTVAAVGLIVGQVSNSGFTISALSTIAASQANTAYSISYIVVG